MELCIRFMSCTWQVAVMCWIYRTHSEQVNLKNPTISSYFMSYFLPFNSITVGKNCLHIYSLTDFTWFILLNLEANWYFWRLKLVGPGIYLYPSIHKPNTTIQRYFSETIKDKTYELESLFCGSFYSLDVQ